MQKKKKKKKKLAASDVHIQPQPNESSNIAEPQDEKLEKHAKCKLYGIYFLMP